MNHIAPELTREQIALNAAIDKAGGKTALMRQLNQRGHDIKSHNVISQWWFTQVPAHYCPDIEALTDTPCEELRADVHWYVLRKTAAKVRARLRDLQAETTTEV